MVKDQTGKSRNLAIMVNDVANLGQIMEEWILIAVIYILWLVTIIK